MCVCAMDGSTRAAECLQPALYYCCDNTSICLLFSSLKNVSVLCFEFCMYAQKSAIVTRANFGEQGWWSSHLVDMLASQPLR